MVFEAQYDDVEMTFSGDHLEGENLQTFFAKEGANAVIDIGNGRLIGLADQIHTEDWYIPLKAYVKRYRHPSGAPGLSGSLLSPVKLRLATVFIWDGETWVTDPLQVLEALSESFKPSVEEWERLKSAVR